MITYRHAHNLDAQQNSDETGLATDREDLARQEFATESDVNVIVRRYGVPQGRQSQYGEVDYTVDLHARKNAAIEAAEAFTRLPRAIRDRYRSWVELLAADPKEIESLLSPAAPVTTTPDKQAAEPPIPQG